MVTVMTNRGLVEFDAKDWSLSQSGVLTIRSGMNQEIATFLPGNYGGAWQSDSLKPQPEAKATPEAKPEEK